MNETKKELNEMKKLLQQMQESVKKLEKSYEKREDMAFDTWLDQYEPDIDISDEGAQLDPEPYIPTQAASEEMIQKALADHRKWEERKKCRNNSLQWPKITASYYIY